MSIQDHVRTALDFLAASDREFAAGDIMQASEKLWGAAAHAATAAVESRGWGHGSHRQLKNSVLRLADELQNPAIRAGFAAAEKFHMNFYRNNMEESEIADGRPQTRELVNRLIASISKRRRERLTETNQ